MPLPQKSKTSTKKTHNKKDNRESKIKKVFKNLKRGASIDLLYARGELWDFLTEEQKAILDKETEERKTSTKKTHNKKDRESKIKKAIENLKHITSIDLLYIRGELDEFLTEEQKAILDKEIEERKTSTKKTHNKKDRESKIKKAIENLKHITSIDLLYIRGELDEFLTEEQKAILDKEIEERKTTK